MTFQFKHRGFDIKATVTHTGSGISVVADLIHPNMPSAEEVFALIAAALSKKAGA